MSTKATINKIRKRLEKEVKEAITEIEDVVEASFESFAELKGIGDYSEVGGVIADEVVPRLPLPWYVPVWVAKLAVKNAIDKAITKALAKV